MSYVNNTRAHYTKIFKVKIYHLITIHILTVFNVQKPQTLMI